MKRKVLAMTLAAMTAMSLFAGCTKKEKAADTAKETDKKYTIKIFTTRNQPAPDSEVMKQIQEKIGGHTLEVTAVPDVDYNAKLNLYYSSNEMPDVFTSNGQLPILKGGTAKFTEEELKKYVPLGYATALKQYEMSGATKENVFNRFTVDGKLTGFYMGQIGITIPYGITIRTDILEELGKSMPKTLADYEDLFKAYKAKYPNKYPVTARGKDAPQQMFYMFISAFGTSTDKWQMVDNKLVYGPFMPEMREALETMQNWYKAGYINPEFITMDNAAVNNEAIKGNTIVSQFLGLNNIIAAPYTPGSVQEQIVAANPKAKFDWAPFPTAKAGVKPAANVYECVVDQPMCFGKQLDTDRDKLHAVMGVMDKLCNNEEIVLLRSYGIKDKHYTLVNGVPTFKPEYNNADAQKKEGTNWLAFGTMGKNWDIEQKISAPKYIENIKTMVQDTKGLYGSNNIQPTFTRVNGTLTSASGENLSVKGSAKQTEWYGVIAQVVCGKMSMADYDKFIENWKKEVGNDQTEAANRLFLKQWQK
jgi:putative aldouronate transport system substrate-binding protein